MNIMKHAGHNFKVLSTEERELRGDADCSQLEYCLKCGMRLDYFNKHELRGSKEMMCKVISEKEVTA